MHNLVFLTNNLQVDAGCVFNVLDLHVEVVLPRVLPVRLAYEQDCVHVAVPHAGERGLQLLALFAPRDLWPGLSLQDPRRSETEVHFTYNSELDSCEIWCKR